MVWHQYSHIKARQYLNNCNRRDSMTAQENRNIKKELLPFTHRKRMYVMTRINLYAQHRSPNL